MTKAGYIHDQRCPTNPEHGNANALENGMFCPHSGHTSPKTGITQAFWTWPEWEDAKSQPNLDPAQPVPATSRKTRKPNARQANRRRTS